MSTQRGSSSRSRPQKHQNRSAFKNNLHDTSQRTKQINCLNVSDVCLRCKDIIEWKIKYKKYKPRSQPGTCVKCQNKTVFKAYHVMCNDCGKAEGKCTKCCHAKDVINPKPNKQEQAQLDNEIKNDLEKLPERKRRTVLRLNNRVTKCPPEDSDDFINKKDKLIEEKLNELKVDEIEDGVGSDSGEYEHGAWSDSLQYECSYTSSL